MNSPSSRSTAKTGSYAVREGGDNTFNNNNSSSDPLTSPFKSTTSSEVDGGECPKASTMITNSKDFHFGDQSKHQPSFRPQREIPWDTLVADGPKLDPVIRTLVDEGGYPFPNWLWNLSIGLCFSGFELCFSATRPQTIGPKVAPRPAALSRSFSRAAIPSSQVSKRPKLFAFIVTSLGVEARLQQKLSLTCVCQHIDVIVGPFFVGFRIVVSLELCK